MVDLSEVACAVKFLALLKVKFYFRKIKDIVFSQSPSLLRRQSLCKGAFKKIRFYPLKNTQSTLKTGVRHYVRITISS